jgi:hypothetical protein
MGDRCGKERARRSGRRADAACDDGTSCEIGQLVLVAQAGRWRPRSRERALERHGCPNGVAPPRRRSAHQTRTGPAVVAGAAALRADVGHPDVTGGEGALAVALDAPRARHVC